MKSKKSLLGKNIDISFACVKLVQNSIGEIIACIDLDKNEINSFAAIKIVDKTTLFLKELENELSADNDSQSEEDATTLKSYLNDYKSGFERLKVSFEKTDVDMFNESVDSLHRTTEKLIALIEAAISKYKEHQKLKVHESK